MSSLIFEDLRKSTHDIHQKMEECVPLMRKDVGEDQVHRFIAAYWVFYQKLQETFQRLEIHRALPDFQNRLKSPNLSEEQKKYFQQFSQKSLEIPHLNNIFQALGALYVFEGSTLGGQVITKHLKERILNPQFNYEAIAPYQEKTGMMWQQFKQQVLKFVSENPGAEKDILSGAQETFQAYHRWLKETL